MKTEIQAAFETFKDWDRPNVFSDTPEECCDAEKRRFQACSNASDEASVLAGAFPAPSAVRSFDFDQENSLEIFPDGSLYERSNADSSVWGDASDFRNERLRDEILTAGLREFFGESEPEEPSAFRITERRFFYGPDVRESWVEEHGKILEFDSKEAAQAWIDEREGETYYLSHNESGRPAFIITPVE